MIFASFDYEQSLWQQGKQYVAGIDEVGRGCFAGPLVASAVIFSKNCNLLYQLADSKLLSAEKRKELAEYIKEDAFTFAIVQVDTPTINRIGIGNATHKAFRQVLNKLGVKPDHLLVDGFYIHRVSKKSQTAIIKGDQLSASIAAASIIAKVYRDELMTNLDCAFPNYHFAMNKGYGTKEHREAIKQFGLSKMHRTSFALEKYV